MPLSPRPVTLAQLLKPARRHGKPHPDDWQYEHAARFLSELELSWAQLGLLGVGLYQARPALVLPLAAPPVLSSAVLPSAELPHMPTCIPCCRCIPGTPRSFRRCPDGETSAGALVHAALCPASPVPAGPPSSLSTALSPAPVSCFLLALMRLSLFICPCGRVLSPPRSSPLCPAMQLRLPLSPCTSLRLPFPSSPALPSWAQSARPSPAPALPNPASAAGRSLGFMARTRSAHERSCRSIDISPHSVELFLPWRPCGSSRPCQHSCVCVESSLGVDLQQQSSALVEQSSGSSGRCCWADKGAAGGAAGGAVVLEGVSRQ